MGTINYGTSDYITLGIKPYDPDDFINDTDWLDFVVSEWGVNPDNEEEVRSAAYDEISDDYECDAENFKAALNKYSDAYGGFYYFHIELKPGYYEGLYVDIENNMSVAFDDWREKKDAQKEITKIRAFLREIAGCGFVQVFPGWCTSYKDYKTTLAAIDDAVKGMREEVRNTPTLAQYNRGCA